MTGHRPTALLLLLVLGIVVCGAAPAAAAGPCGPAPIAVAHRGGTERALENTLGAVRSAADAGVTHWEVDVRFDVRGLPVVLHDETVDRVSPRSGPIAGLDAADGAIPTDDGQYIPSLSEVYAEAARHRATVFTELKVMPTAGQWRVLADEIDASVGRSGVVVMSFSRDVVLAAREWIPGAATGLVHNAGYLDASQIVPYGGNLMKSYRVISESRALEWYNAGVSLYAWTVDAETDWSRLSAWPVTGIITDRPIAYRQWAATRCQEDEG